jgi:nitrogen fixation protein FixH
MNAIRQRGITGRHVLAIVVSFFAAVVAVNGAMVCLALDSHPGLTSRDAYREGLAHNRALEARQEQLALGWRATVDVAEAGAVKTVVARFRDRHGAPVTGLGVAAEWTRPVASGNDSRAEMTETEPGTYRADTPLPLPGKWRLEVVTRSESGTPWRMERELWLK